MSQFPTPSSTSLGGLSSNTTKSNPLTSVRLPPPTADQAYTWSINAQAPIQRPLRESASMLRTPDSIIKPHETSLKRGAAEFDASRMKLKSARTEINEFKASELNKAENNEPQVKVTWKSESMYGSESIALSPRANSSQRTSRQFEMPPTHMENSGQWSAYFENAFPGFEFSRSSAASQSSEEIQATRQSRQFVRNVLTNASPHNSKLAAYAAANPEFLNTPTKGNRASETSPEIATYRAMHREMPSNHHLDIAQQHGVIRQHEKHDRKFNTFQPPPMPPIPMQIDNNYCLVRPTSSPTTFIDIPEPDKMPPVEDDGKKPSYSYAMLIGMAILRAPGRKLTLAQIYQWIIDSFEYYRNSKPAWHNSIRHNLSLNKAFEKRVRPKEDPGKGSYWTIVEGFECQFLKVRPQKKSNEYIDEPLELERINRTGKSIVDSQRPVSQSSELDSIQPPRRSLPQELNRQDSRPRSAALSVELSSVPNLMTVSDLSASYSLDVIPSDGTEPDERLIEEDERLSQGLPMRSLPKQLLSSGKMQSKNDSEKTESMNHSTPATKQGKIMKKLAHEKLPQMHTMSSQNPQSPITRGDANEWRGQGQLAFRCSTPSILSQFHGNINNHGITRPMSSQSLHLNQLSQLVPDGISNKDRPSSGGDLEKSSKNSTLVSPHQANLEISSLPNLSGLQNSESVLNTNPTADSNSESKPSSKRTPVYPGSSGDLHHRSTSTSGQLNGGRPEIALQPPKTPEKLLSGVACMSSGKSNFQYLVPSLLQRKSLESPYAGTLDYTPGIALADFADFDIQKSTSFVGAPGHTRTESNSSNDSQGSQTSLSNSHVHLQNHSLLASNFAMALDFDSGLHNIMTPVRRPFDTPIRDQTHTYSPYYRTANSIGSPIKKH